MMKMMMLTYPAGCRGDRLSTVLGAPPLIVSQSHATIVIYTMTSMLMVMMMVVSMKMMTAKMMI